MSKRFQTVKKISYPFEYIALSSICFVSRQLPLGIAAFLWKTFALTLFYMVPGLSKTASQNIRQTIGNDWSEDQIKNLVRKVFIHSGYFLAEWFNTPKLPPDFNKDVTFIGEEHIQSALAQGKGVVCVSGHFGHWEVMGHAVTTRGYKFNVIYKKMSNPLVDKIFYDFRTNYSEDLIEIGEWKEKSPAVFRNNEVIGIVADQDARHHGIFVPFLGKDASTFKGPALFALENDAPLIVSFFWREKPGKYKISYEPVLVDETLESRDEQVLDLTKKWVAILDRQVRQYPDQYFWFHRRWKTQPSTTNNSKPDSPK